MGVRGLVAASLVLAGCGGAGARTAAEIVRQVSAADIVLLGEVHDNLTGHAIRGALIEALGSRRPAVVFEQFAAADSALAKPGAGDSGDSAAPEPARGRRRRAGARHQAALTRPRPSGGCTTLSS